MKLSEYDCYIATGGGFEINDPSSDLGVAISILSSLKNIPPIENCSFIGDSSVKTDNKIYAVKKKYS